VQGSRFRVEGIDYGLWMMNYGSFDFAQDRFMDDGLGGL